MDLMNLVARISVDISDFQKGIAQLTGGMGNVSALSVAAGNLIAKGFSTAVGAVKDFGGYIMESGMSFEETMSKVQAISGASGEGLADLTAKAQEMGAKTKFSATESAEAFTYMAMAGWKTNDMLGGIEGIMNLAAASGEDLAMTSDIVTDALTAFGESANEAGRLADILAAASSNSNTNVAMMGETFKYAAPVAGALGYSMEDTALAIGLMANAGIKSSQAGTSLRAILTNLSSPTEKIEQGMKTLGISLTDDEGKMKSFREVMVELRTAFSEGNLTQEEYSTRLQIIEDSLANGKLEMSEYSKKQQELSEKLSAGTITVAEYDKGIEELDRLVAMGLINDTASYEQALQDLNIAMYGADSAQKAQLASTIAGKNAMSGFLAIVGASDEDFNKLVTSIDNCGQTIVKTKDGAFIPMSQAMEEGIEWVEEYKGSAEAMAAVMQDNLAGSITILKSGVEGLALTFYNEIKGTAKESVDALTSAVGTANEKLRTWLSSEETQQKIGVITEKIQVLIDKLLENLDPALDAIIGLFGALVDGLVFVVDHFDQIAAVVGTVIQVFAALKAAMLALQVLGFVANLITLAGSFSPIGIAITALIAVIALLATNFDTIKNVAHSAWEAIKSVWDAAVGFFKGVVDGIIKAFTGFAEKIGNFFRNAWDFAQKAWNTAVNWFTTLVTNIVNGFTSIPEKLGNFFKTAWSNIQTAWDGAVNFFGDVIGKILKSFSDIPEKMKSIGKNIVEGLWNGINSMVSWISEKVQGFTDSVVGKFKDFFGIHSPSVVMEQKVGKYIGQGIGVGIEKEADFIQNAFDSVMPTYTPEAVQIGHPAMVGGISDETIGKFADAVVEAINRSGMNKASIELDGRVLGRYMRDGMGVEFV